MATQGTYYLDAPSLSSASVIYTDANLTTVAPDGFYSDGVISREQASGSLLPQQACPSCNSEFLVGFGLTTNDACNFVASATVTADDPDFCSATTFTGAIFSSSGTGTRYISFGGYSLEISITSGNPVATVTGICVVCTPSFLFSGCGVSNIDEGAACGDANTNPKTLYSDCSTLSAGCVICWDAALQSPVTETYLFVPNQNWDMDGNGVIVSSSAIQC